MKPFRIALFLAIAAIILTPGGMSAEKYDVQVVLVGIGAKNATFDEARFPHLKFAYTPGLVSQANLDETGKSALSLFGGKAARETFKGTPEILEKWWDETDLRDHAILFDKNGVGVWEGSLARDDDDLMACKGKGDESEMEDALEKYVLKGKEADFDKGKTFDPSDSDALIEMKVPDFEVVTPKGEKVSIKSIVETGKPTLLVFFQISANVNLKEAKESGEGKSSGDFLSSMTKGAAGSKWDRRMLSLESQLFGYDAREK